jgi:hypothetical protein
MCKLLWYIFSNRRFNARITITSGERLDSIIQKFAMILSNGLGACTSSDLQHDPYNVYAGTITSSTASILWDGVWSSSTGVNIYYDTQVAPTGWVLANTNTYCNNN